MEFNNEEIVFHGDNDHDLFYINLSLSSYCNYKCSYCISKIQNDKKFEFISYKDIINTIDRLINFNKEKYFIILIGGEPTIHPNFIDIIKYINNINKKIYLRIVTNGAKSIDFFEEVFKNSNNINFIMTISIHLEYANIEHIKKLIILSNKYNINIIFAFMLHPILKDKIMFFYDELFQFRKYYNFNIYFSELLSGENFDTIDKRYTYSDFELFEKMRSEFNNTYNNEYNMYINKPFYIIDKNNNNIKIENIDYISKSRKENKKHFKGMYCCYGINLVSIWGNGYTTGGECILFNNFRQNIHNDVYNWYQNIGYIKCNLDECNCALNNHLPKFREEEEAKKFIEEYKLKHSHIFIQDAYKQLENIKNNFVKVEDYNYNISLLNKEIEKNNIQINKLVNSIAWWIPVKKWRDNFRNKIFNTDQTRPDQTRPHKIICKGYILFYNNSKYKKIQHIYKTAA